MTLAPLLLTCGPSESRSENHPALNPADIDYYVQTIGDLSAPVRLGSSLSAAPADSEANTDANTGADEQANSNNASTDDPAHTWWITTAQIDPTRFSRTWLANMADASDAGDRLRDPVTTEADWLPVRVPYDVSSLPGYDSRSGTFWYRKAIYFPNRRVAQARPLNLYLGVIDDADRVYLNGTLIGGSGDMQSSLPQAYDKVRHYLIPPAQLRAGPNIILVEVKRYFATETGIFKGDVAIGPADDMLAEYHRENYVHLFFSIVYFTVGCYFLFLFFRRRKERENLFYGLFSLAFVGYNLFRNQIKYQWGVDFFTLKRIEYCLLFLIMPPFYYFARTYFEIPRNRFTRIVDGVNFVVCLLLILSIGLILGTDDVELWSNYQLFFSQLVLWPFLLITMLGIFIYHAVKYTSVDAIAVLVGLVVILLSMVYDTLALQLSLDLPFIFNYTFFAFIASLAVLLANRFVRVNEEVEDLNKNLEAKVERRTRELNRTLNEVRELKNKQDGDYFLTSLLIDPLSSSHVESQTVEVRFFTTQMKKFRFRRWTAEIGGDLSLAQSIHLKERDFTAFLNADAMGKSIQGAGGALVLGTVFKSLIARTQLSSQARDVFPEQWLKACLIELQNVFVSFDGYMLLSAIIGLVDDETGLVYYINADHPIAAVYRQGRASFIEDAPAMRKIGWTEADARLCIRTFQMHPGDVLYLGTDGRDDLVVGAREDGNCIINEDETLFLRNIESGDGVLERVVEAINASGDLSDDLSLVRIAYQEDASAIRPEQDYDRKAFAQAVQTGDTKFANNDYASAEQAYELALSIYSFDRITSGAVRRKLALTLLAAAEQGQPVNLNRLCFVCEMYLTDNPDDSEFFIPAARAYHLKGDLRTAADYGERYRLRNTEESTLNLLQLAQIYSESGNTVRARKFVDYILHREPHNAAAINIKERLSRTH
ncbi:MAG: SpoIIE family protein phosphatase [Leptospiraceae bacterium]|nr:SpoIIE family protein phosphatase [Leptospiraceae bacterium]